MTIDIGFAFLDNQITIIDVPGHEKFVKNMMSGSSGIDIAIVVVAQISFIIPMSAIPGRVALVVTQFLTLTNIFIHEMVRYYFTHYTINYISRINRLDNVPRKFLVSLSVILV